MQDDLTWFRRHAASADKKLLQPALAQAVNLYADEQFMHEPTKPIRLLGVFEKFESDIGTWFGNDRAGSNPYSKYRNRSTEYVQRLRMATAAQGKAIALYFWFHRFVNDRSYTDPIDHAVFRIRLEDHIGLPRPWDPDHGPLEADPAGQVSDMRQALRLDSGDGVLALTADLRQLLVDGQIDAQMALEELYSYYPTDYERKHEPIPERGWLRHSLALDQEDFVDVLPAWPWRRINSDQEKSALNFIECLAILEEVDEDLSHILIQKIEEFETSFLECDRIMRIHGRNLLDGSACSLLIARSGQYGEFIELVGPGNTPIGVSAISTEEEALLYLAYNLELSAGCSNPFQIIRKIEKLNDDSICPDSETWSFLKSCLKECRSSKIDKYTFHVTAIYHWHSGIMAGLFELDKFGRIINIEEDVITKNYQVRNWKFDDIFFTKSYFVPR